VTSTAWFNRDHELTPGRELFRSDRRFQIWAYTTSHGQLLLRATPRYGADGRPDHETTIDVLFKPLEALKLKDSFTGLVIRCASAEEGEHIKESLPDLDWNDLHIFMLESQGQVDYVVSMAVGWHEGILPRMQQSFYNGIVPGDKWPTKELFGVGAGFEVASAQELIDALADENYTPGRRDRCRYLHVLMVRSESGRGAYAAGVFLTEEDAEEARLLFAPKVHDCWVDLVPIAM
jgi:hypothetical protein